MTEIPAYPCRHDGCEGVFNSPQARGSHEFWKHGWGTRSKAEEAVIEGLHQAIKQQFQTAIEYAKVIVDELEKEEVIRSSPSKRPSS